MRSSSCGQENAGGKKSPVGEIVTDPQRSAKNSNSQTVYGGHGSLSGGNLHGVSMLRFEGKPDGQSNIAGCGPDFCDKGVAPP